MNKYEKLIEYIINDDEKKARALFHEIVVEKSRSIYESLMDEEMHGEAVGGNPVDNMMDEIQADESGLPEDEEMSMDMDDEQVDSEMGDELGGDDMGGEGDIEGRVMDLESELEALKAEFEQLMAGEEEEGHHDDMDMDMDMDMSGDEENGEEDQMMEASDDDDDDDEVTESKEEDDDDDNDDEVTESVGDDDDDDDDDDEMTESRRVKSEIELMREYVEKVSMQYPNAGGEGQLVGTGKNGNKPSVNKKSIIDNMKNDMGGTTQNIVKGGTEEAPDGKQYKGPSNEYTKGQGEIEVAKRNVNKPGGNKGAQNWYSNKASAKDAEGSTTDGSMSVAKDSILKRIN